MAKICKTLNSGTQMVAWFKCYTTRASLNHYGGNCLEVSKAMHRTKNYRFFEVKEVKEVKEVTTVGLFEKKGIKFV